MTISHIIIPAAAHDAFGCAYPVTYRWTLPAASSGLSARARYGLGSWFALPNLAAGANGVDGVRFDYANNQAFLSVAFGPNDDDLYLKVVDASGNPVGSFDAVEDYYDSRQAACVISWDDWHTDHHAAFVACTEEHQANGVWCSMGINAGYSTGLTAAQWADMQALVDVGYLEPINHGYTHADPDDVAYDADVEIGQGVQAIVDNLTLPSQSRRGNEQYVLGWMEPWGRTNASLQAALAPNRLINQRRSAEGSVSLPYATFNESLGVFDRQLVSALLDDITPATANERFDTAYGAGGIYHGYGHPWAFNFEGGAEPMAAHIAHVAGRDDVWYVGWGHLSVYRYTTLNVLVEPVTVTWEPASIHLANPT